VKELGIEKIKEIVESTTFLQEDKDVLLAKILLKINEPAQCLTILNQQPTTSNQQLKFYTANCHYLLKDCEAARSLYEQALTNNQQLTTNNCFAETHNNLGCTLTVLGDTKKAEEHFNNALQLRPNYMDPKKNLKIILSTNNKQQTTNTASAVHLTLFELRKELLSY